MDVDLIGIIIQAGCLGVVFYMLRFSLPTLMTHQAQLFGKLLDVQDRQINGYQSELAAARKVNQQLMEAIIKKGETTHEDPTS